MHALHMGLSVLPILCRCLLSVLCPVINPIILRSWPYYLCMCLISQIPNTNITIKKGMAVYISIYGLHEDPQYFEDPGTFDPSRFDQGRGISEAYMPFGAGPRMCLGMKIGYLHAKVATAMVLANYEVYQKLEERLILDPRSTFTAAADGLLLRFRELDNEQRIQL
ncbi:cytochrome P450 6j1-like [Cydia pomonella]|uniref:cytochrome P450 6j1-like n=1 Tax=Cydia pomonella TaxID=82600 RepID=UPI002ADDA490|nr:cytochrome P450 6j1-like [Cydia pomonella]